jgi:hypothetical protein
LPVHGSGRNPLQVLVEGSPLIRLARFGYADFQQESFPQQASRETDLIAANVIINCPDFISGFA